MALSLSTNKQTNTITLAGKHTLHFGNQDKTIGQVTITNTLKGSIKNIPVKQSKAPYLVTMSSNSVNISHSNLNMTSPLSLNSTTTYFTFYTNINKLNIEPITNNTYVAWNLNGEGNDERGNTTGSYKPAKITSVYFYHPTESQWLASLTKSSSGNTWEHSGDLLSNINNFLAEGLLKVTIGFEQDPLNIDNSDVISGFRISPCDSSALSNNYINIYLSQPGKTIGDLNANVTELKVDYTGDPISDKKTITLTTANGDVPDWTATFTLNN